MSAYWDEEIERGWAAIGRAYGEKVARENAASIAQLDDRILKFRRNLQHSMVSAWLDRQRAIARELSR